MEEFEKALQYVRDNKNWSDAEEAVALERIDHWRVDLANTGMGISEKIYDLMEEYSADNDLPEGWWLEFGDIEDFFMEIES